MWVYRVEPFCKIRATLTLSQTEKPQMTQQKVFPFFYREFRKDCEYFTYAQTGAYFQLMCQCWEFETINEKFFSHLKEEFTPEEFHQILSKFQKVPDGYQHTIIEASRHIKL